MKKRLAQKWFLALQEMLQGSTMFIAGTINTQRLSGAPSLFNDSTYISLLTERGILEERSHEHLLLRSQSLEQHKRTFVQTREKRLIAI